MLLIGNINITKLQLVYLGAKIKKEDKLYTLYNDSPELQSDFNQTIDTKNIFLSPEYWMSWMGESSLKMNSITELDWLIVTAKYFQFEGNENLISRIKKAVRFFEELNLSNLPSKEIIGYWLYMILEEDEDKPWVIFDQYQYFKKKITDPHNFSLGIKLENYTEFKAMSLGKKEELLFGNDYNKINLNFKNLNIKSFQDKFKLAKVAWDIGYAGKGFFVQTALETRNTIKRRGVYHRKASIVKLHTLASWKGIKKAFPTPSLILIFLDGADSILTLVNPMRTAKETRDSVATYVFIGGELSATIIATLMAVTPGVNILIGASSLAIAFGYSGFSLSYEHKDDNLSFLERWNTFSRGFWQQDIHPNIQKYLHHKQYIDNLTKYYHSILSEDRSICFITSSIGEYDTEQSIILPANITIELQKKQRRKISRLTPELPDVSTKLDCAPAFKQGEPESTANYLESEWYCFNSFILSSLHSYNVLEFCTGIFDLQLADSGLINFGEKKVNFKSIFQLGNSSKLEIVAARNNSPPSEFVFPKEGFSGYLKGDPINKIKHIINTFYVNEAYVIIVREGYIRIHERKTDKLISEAQFSDIPIFIGHRGSDIIYCEEKGIQAVDLKGGLIDGEDIIVNCNQASVRSHTIIVNDDLERIGYYILLRDSIAITLYNFPNKITFLSIDGVMTDFVNSYQINYELERRFLTIKKRGSIRYFLLIHFYPYINSNIIFIDKENTKFFFQFEPFEETNNLTLHVFYSIELNTQLNIQELSVSKHNEILDSSADIFYTGQFYDVNNPSEHPRLILGSRDKNIIYLNNLKQLDYVRGNDDVDFYVLEQVALQKINASAKLTIDNYSVFSKIDELHFPLYIDEINISRNLFNLDIKFMNYPLVVITVKDYFLDSSYQHLIFMDSDKFSFIPFILENNQVELIPYCNSELHPTENKTFCRVSFIQNKQYPYRLVFEDNASINPLMESGVKLNLRTHNKILIFFFYHFSMIIPIKDFSSELLIGILTTKHAGFLKKDLFVSQLKLKLVNTRDILPFTQAKILEQYIFQTYGNESFTLESFPIIPLTYENKESFKLMLMIDVPILDIKLGLDQNDLLLTLYNEELHTITFKLINWNNATFPKIGLIIQEKLIPIALSRTDLGEKPLDQLSLEELNRELRISLLQKWIDLQLEAFSFNAKTIALCKILNLFDLSSLARTIITEKIYPLFKISDENPIFRCDFRIDRVREVSKVAQVFVLYYAKIVSQYPRYHTIFSELFSQKDYRLIFGNFKELARDFILFNKNFKKNIFDYRLVRKTQIKLLTEGERQGLDLIIKDPFYLKFVKKYFFESGPQSFNKSLFFDLNTTPYIDTKLRFIEINQVPADVEFTSQDNDLLMALSNQEKQKIVFRIKNWDQPHQRWDGIIIRKKVLPVALFEYSLSSNDINRLNFVFRKALLDRWINEELKIIPNYYQEEAIVRIIEPIVLNKGLVEALHLYKLFNYNSEELFQHFYQEFVINNTGRLTSYTEDQKIYIADSIILFYSKIVILSPDYKKYISNCISLEDYNLLFGTSTFKDFYFNFQQNVFNPNIIGKIMFSLVNTNEESTIKYKFNIYNFYDSEHNIFFDYPRDYLISHNFYQNNTKLGSLYFDDYPPQITIKIDKQDLLFLITNYDNKTSLIRIRHWHESLHRLEQVFVKNKALPLGQALSKEIFQSPIRGFQDFRANFESRTTKSLRKALIVSWLDEHLELLPTQSKETAKYHLSKCLTNEQLEQCIREFGFNSRFEFIESIYNPLKAKNILLNLTFNERNALPRAIILYYVKIIIRFPHFLSYFENLVSDKSYKLIFFTSPFKLENSFLENQIKIKECIFHPQVLQEINVAINNALTESQKQTQEDQKFQECQLFNEKKGMDPHLADQLSIVGFQNLTSAHQVNLLQRRLEVTIPQPKISKIEGSVTSGVTRSENVLNLLAKMYIEPFRKTILRFFLSNRESHQSVFPMTSIQNFEQANTHTPMLFLKDSHVELEKPEHIFFEKNCQHNEFNVYSSFNFDESKINKVYTPDIRLLFDQINQQLTLLQVVLHQGIKLYGWFQSFFSTKYNKASNSPLLTSITLKQIKKWKKSLKKIESNLNYLKNLVNEEKELRWVWHILEDRKEEFEYLSRHTELELERVNAFTENLQILHSELKVMINRALAIHENNKSGLTRKINEIHSNILNDNSLRPIPFLFKKSVVNQQNLEFDFGFYPRFFKFPSSVLSMESINVNEKLKNICYKNKTL